MRFAFFVSTFVSLITLTTGSADARSRQGRRPARPPAALPAAAGAGIPANAPASPVYSHMSSRNIAQLAAPANVFTKSDWLDGNLFLDLTPAVRLGLEYAYFRQTRGDGEKPHNQRVQFSSWFIF